MKTGAIIAGHPAFVTAANAAGAAEEAGFRNAASAASFPLAALAALATLAALAALAAVLFTGLLPGCSESVTARNERERAEWCAEHPEGRPDNGGGTITGGRNQ